MQIENEMKKFREEAIETGKHFSQAVDRFLQWCSNESVDNGPVGFVLTFIKL